MDRWLLAALILAALAIPPAHAALDDRRRGTGPDFASDFASERAPDAAAPPDPARRRGRVPWWSAALLGIATSIAIVACWRFVTGDVLDASVISHDDASCQVQWDAAGASRQDAVGCLDTVMPGDLVRVLARPGGTADTVRDAILGPVSLLLALVLPALLGIAWRARRPQPRRPRRPARAGEPGTPEIPALAAGEIVFSRIGEVMTARATAEGWGAGPAGPTPGPTPDAAPQPRHWWQVKVLRGVATMVIGRVFVPMAALVVAVVLGWSAWLSTATLATSDTAVVYGRVENVGSRPLPFLPYETRLHFHVDRRWAYATVPVTRRLTDGQAVSVLYAVGHHERARIQADGDGLNRTAGITGAVAAVALWLVARRSLRLWRELAGLLKARSGPARPWRYVRFVDPLGGAGLLLFSRLDDGPPVALLPLAPLGDAAAALPVTGEAQVHGEVADRGLAVPVIGGHTCWPLGRVAAAPPDIVRGLVNGDAPAGPARARRTRRESPRTAR